MNDINPASPASPLSKDEQRPPWHARLGSVLRDLPGVQRIGRLPRQLLRISPFGKGIQPTRIPLFSLRSGRPTSPFPHPWNYDRPLVILDTFFWNADAEQGAGRHNRYLDVPGFAPLLVTRDPRVIRAISTETGDRPGQFDRDTLPTTGIGRATGVDSLLYANGSLWKRQKKVVAPSFARSTLFQPEQFHEFAATFRHTVRQRLELVRARIEGTGKPVVAQLEPEIKAIMLEMLVNNFFGAEISYEEISQRYVPAVDRFIDHIVRDTVVNKMGLPLRFVPSFTRGIAEAKKAGAIFEELTTRVIAPRHEGKRLWKQFKSDVPDAALRSNVRVFLAGALEATTSYACWAISHLARNPAAQEKAFAEVRDIEDFAPETLQRAKYLGCVLNETLRLTPSLYFHPRRATADSSIDLGDGEKLFIPRGTHVILDVWHSNRHEDHWGIDVTGHPALVFAPERWESAGAKDHGSSEQLHFGFGHGPRFCPGKNLGQMEVALVVGACVKLFRFEAMDAENPAKSGVSTKPRDGARVRLFLRDPAAAAALTQAIAPDASVPSTFQAPDAIPPACPFARKQNDAAQ